MVQTRSQLKKLSKEMTEELITVEDITSKLSDLSNQLDYFLRRFEVVSTYSLQEMQKITNQDSC